VLIVTLIYSIIVTIPVINIFHTDLILSLGIIYLSSGSLNWNRTTATEPKFKEPIYLDLFELLVLLSTRIYSCDISTEQTPWRVWQ